MKRYFVLIGLILAALGAYTAYWFYALDEAKKGFDRVVAAERARGNDLTFASAEWNGFPIRIGVDLTGVTYRAGGLDFEADTMRVEAMPWQPSHPLVRAVGNVRLAWRDPGMPEAHAARPGLLLASVRFDLSGAFQGADVELRNAILAGPGYTLRAGRLQFDTRFVTGSARGRETFDVAFSADKIDFPEPAPRLGNRMSSIRFAAQISDLPPFSQGWRPADRQSFINYLGESGTQAHIPRLDVEWGQVSAKGTGDLELDAANRFKGKLDFNVVGVRQLIDALSANDYLQPGGVKLPDVPGGTPISLVLKDGLVTFGPFAVSGLPRLD